MLTPNELVLPFGGSYVCANFGENRSRNATVRVLADGQTHRQTDTQTQIDFIICPMLHAIAMGQIISAENNLHLPSLEIQDVEMLLNIKGNHHSIPGSSFYARCLSQWG